MENLDPLLNCWQQKITSIATLSCMWRQPEEIVVEGLPSRQIAVVTNVG